LRLERKQRRTKMKVGAFVVVAIVAGFFGLGAAQAASVENGLTVNGLTVNGLTVNGLTVNGLTVNGLTTNGRAAGNVDAGEGRPVEATLPNGERIQLD
jgi:GLTT repeat (6 copies)